MLMPTNNASHFTSQNLFCLVYHPKTSLSCLTLPNSDNSDKKIVSQGYLTMKLGILTLAFQGVFKRWCSFSNMMIAWLLDGLVDEIHSLLCQFQFISL